MTDPERVLFLAAPRGFCAGVDRAIDVVEIALQVYGPPIYVRHEVVHNKFVVDGLRDRGAVFVDELHEVPDDAIVIFSAHGVSKQVQNEAANRGLKVFDATCPLVTKVHMEVTSYARGGMECVLIGHEGHPEVEGTMGQYDKSNGGDIYLVETVEDVKTLQVRSSLSSLAKARLRAPSSSSAEVSSVRSCPDWSSEIRSASMSNPTTSYFSAKATASGSPT